MKKMWWNEGQRAYASDSAVLTTNVYDFLEREWIRGFNRAADLRKRDESRFDC